jgi:hypothetical protein
MSPTDTKIRSTNILTNKTVKLRPLMIDWLRAEAARNHSTVSAEIRHWLELAYKYRRAITEAENAPVSFVKDRR